MELDEMQAAVFKALAHPVRLQVIKKLRSCGVMCVCELNDDVDFSQSNLSQHLRILKDAGILHSEKEGLKIFYCIKDEEVNHLLDHCQSLIMNKISSIQELFGKR